MIKAVSSSYFTVWDIDVSDKYTTLKLSTSRKDKDSGEYKNSNWSYVRAVGKAHQLAKGLKQRDRITNVNFSMECEPYVKDGVKQFPKSPRITFFEFDVAEGYQNRPSASPAVDEYSPDGDLPF